MDKDDAELEATLGIGRSELPSDPFGPIPSQGDITRYTPPRSDADKLLATARDLATRTAWKELILALEGRESALASEPELVVLRAEAELRVGNLREARAWLEHEMPHVERSANGPLLRRAVNTLGAACFELGDLDAAEAALERVLLLAVAAQAYPNLARATNNLGLIANIRGRPGEALALYRLAVPAFQRVGMARELAEAFHNMAISFRDLRQLREADDHEQRAIDLAQQAGDSRVLAMARVGRAELSLLRGEPRIAEAVARLAVNQYASIPDPIGQADALRLVGIARTASGDWPRAILALDQAVELAQAHGSPLIEAESLGARAECRFAMGDIRQARADGEAAMARYDQLGAYQDAEALRQRWRPGESSEGRVSACGVASDGLPRSDSPLA